MTRRRVVISAKITFIWKITSHNLKVLRHRYLEDVEKYNFYALKIIEFFHQKEDLIKKENIKINKLSYKKEIENIINSLSG